MILTFAFPSSAHRTGGVIALYEFANALARRGHEVHFVHGPAWPTRVNSLDELPSFAFDPALRHHLVDTLDDPTLPESDVVFAPEAPARLGLPAVFMQGYKMWLEEVERYGFRFPAPKICIAEWLVDVGVKFGSPSEQLWHIPMGIDIDLFARRTPLDQRPIDLAMLYHPHRQKGWDVGRAVLAELRRRRPDARLVVFSRVRPREPLPDGVEFVFSPDQRKLADEVYNASRVFVQASNHEGFGFTAIEAMACGSALVTTDNGGSRDYALAGETALVVPPGDVDGLVGSVERLFADDELRTRLARAGEQHVKRFDWDLSGEILEAKLTQYLADPSFFQQPPLAEDSEREEVR